MADTEFRERFRDLTGNEPLLWQERLFREHFATGELPLIIDLPTGVGKTMVMAIWLVARELCPGKVPTRLIYVVDRRTVVDQATDLAKRLQGNFGEDKLAISTLRGQLADNREWSRDPCRPAIIIGTVDLIGSALLFSGYRSSYKRRPLEAGLLGQDSLLVLDEAHLSRPFEKLAYATSNEGQFQKARDGNRHGNPMRVIRMSATSGSLANSKTFTLQFDHGGNLAEDDAQDAIVSKRFSAKKRLNIVTLSEKGDLNKKLADIAIELAENADHVGKRIVVFVRSPDSAKVIADLIRKHTVESVDESGTKPKKTKQALYIDRVEVLTGTMRGLERDELVPAFRARWLNGDLDPLGESNQEPVFLISTSAGEVGFDLNADHLVGDAAPLDSWIQRLGRVNRRGEGDATVILVKEQEPTGKTDFDDACRVTSELLTNGMDVSPKALAAFNKLVTAEQKNDEASSPKPISVELTDILLDAWSMTSITERMPGRPEVAPWLRGISDELPQTTIVWRGELELVRNHPYPAKVLQNIFSKHPIRPHELITTNSYRVAEFLKRACKLKDRPDDLPNTRVALRLSRGKIVLRTIKELADDPGILNAEPTLIFPTAFGGLDAAGMLDADAIPKSPKADDPPTPSLDVGDHPGYEQREDATPRLRLLIHRTGNGEWAPESLPGGVTHSELLQLQAIYPTSTVLFADLRKTGLRIRLVQPIELDEEGDAVRSLVLLSPVSNTRKPEDQLLEDHVSAVETEAMRIANALGLAEGAPVRIALLFAARWHDEGKKAGIWQRFVYGLDRNGQYKGKSSKSRDPKSLRGYRHEFGSLARILCPDRRPDFCDLPTDEDTLDLALHLIATHHGFGRPHFENPFDHEFKTAHCETVHTEAVRRFARLQRQYGWWQLAWLENLLRCADALGSADDDSEDDPTDSGDEA